MNERLSDYLLGELDDAERAAFEAELARDPALAAEVERLRPIVSRLESLDARRVGPAGGARARDAAAGGARGAARRPRRARPPWWRRALVAAPARRGRARARPARPRRRRRPAARRRRRRRRGAVSGRVLALDPVEPLGGAAHGTATISTQDGRADVQVRGLKPSADGDFYELWLLNSPDDLVSLGSFRVPASGEVDVSVPLPGNPDDFAALDVSVEPPDGNPAHSSRSVLRAPLKPS